jgi:hypothetical protein
VTMKVFHFLLSLQPTAIFISYHCWHSCDPCHWLAGGECAEICCRVKYTFYTLEEHFNYFNHNKNDNKIWML